MARRRWVKHIVKEGARVHLLSWDEIGGRRCSEPNCIINREYVLRAKERRLWRERSL